MIPAIILPAYNRHDLLLRLLESIDVPVGRGLILDNDRSLVIHTLSRFDHLLRELNIERFRPPFRSLGYGGSINFGLAQFADCEWVMWASNDVVFEPGTLAQIAQIMDDRSHGSVATIVTGGFTWGAINRAAVAAVGLIDEWSFFPIYFDDNDYHYRCVLAGVEWIELSGWKHGDDGIRGSATIHADPAVAERNHLTFRENENRYRAKWGGPPGREVYTTPWNSGFPVRLVNPDLTGRAARQW